MGLNVSLVVYAEKEKETPYWDLRWELVDELTASWLIRKLEQYISGTRQFVLLNEIKMEIDSMNVEVLGNYLKRTTSTE